MTALTVPALALLSKSASSQAYTFPSHISAVEKSQPQEKKGSQSNPGKPRTSAAVTLSVKDSTLHYTLYEIARQAGLRLVYDDPDTFTTKRITISISRSDPMQAFAAVLKGTGYSATLMSDGETVGIHANNSARPGSAPRNRTEAQGETGTLTGRVVDSATGEGMVGVSVSIEGRNITVISRSNGDFVLQNVPVGEQRVSFKLLGYKSISRLIVVESQKRVVVNAALAQSANMLSGVVTTATGDQKRLEVGNSIVALNVDSIMQVAPVSSITDLLESRVPGMTIQRTSGTPGDPSRIRLRGTSSIYANNDPIIVVDGVRIYSQQSEERNVNEVSYSEPGGGFGSETVRRYATPSPIDQIDPNSIERIEVLKGPSASAMYGSDAANGVIIITTKRGRSGTPQLNVALNQGLSYMPGSWPAARWQWFTPTGGGMPQVCRGDCRGLTIDSTVVFSTLNDPYFTALGRGNSSDASATISGGSQTFNYAFTVSGGIERGVLKLPRVEEDRYLRYQGEAAPRWMRRPDNLERRSGTANVGIQFSDRASMSLTSTLSQQKQQRTSMSASGQSAIRELEQTWADRSQMPERPLLGNPYEKVTSQLLNLVNSVQLTLRPAEWLPVNATVGLNSEFKNNEMMIPRGLLSGVAENGVLNGSTNTSSTMTVSANTLIPLRTKLDLAAGINMVKGSTYDQKGGFRGFAEGVLDPATGEEAQSTSYSRTDYEQNSFGWFLEPRVNLRSRLFVMPGFRLDNNGLAGKNASLNSLPKLNLSWIASDEDFFPLKDVFGLFRVRLAFGVAGVQPRPGDTHRLYTRKTVNPFNSTDPLYGTLLSLDYLGNTRLKPERGVEWEGGFDAEVWDGRLSLDVTHYRKRRNNAIVDNPYAMSVDGGGKSKVNVGDLENTGAEVTVGTQLLESSLLGVRVNTLLSWHRSKVLRLSEDGEQIRLSAVGGRQDLVYAVGYPMDGLWQRPILGFGDRDGDGWLSHDEIVIGAEPVFVGSTEPRFALAMHPAFSILRGRVGINMGFSYTNGMTQDLGIESGTLNGLWGSMKQGENLDQQAALVAISTTRYGFVQEVSQLRFQSFSATTSLGASATRFLKARSASISLQGNNLGLWTNYMGVDPNVNAILGGHGVMDGGQLPAPRMWKLRLSLGY